MFTLTHQPTGPLLLVTAICWGASLAVQAEHIVSPTHFQSLISLGSYVARLGLLGVAARQRFKVACLFPFRFGWGRTALLLVGLLPGAGISLLAQDTRKVSEPTFPPVCAVFRAPLRSTSEGPSVGPSRDEQNAESKPETQMLQTALSSNSCQPGQAVELALGSDPAFNAFLLDPLTVPTGISLIIDGGVTVFGSRDPALYQDLNNPTDVCGTYGPYTSLTGCVALLTFSGSSGIYGYGVLDGQGNQPLLSGMYAGQTWWDLTRDKGNTNQQSNPEMISAGNLKKMPSGNFTMYKITVRNPPFHTMNLGGDGLTIWGVKVQAPWNVPNTDGFDIHGTNVTVYDTTIANGDQQIALPTNGGPTANMTVDHLHGYNKGGIALLGGGGYALSYLLFKNITMTADLPSVVGTTVNGLSEADMMAAPYNLKSYTQALPNATSNLHGLQVLSRSNTSIDHVVFQSACLQDVGIPINIAPEADSAGNFPALSGVTFKDIHVLAPTSQFPALVRGLPADPTNPSAPGSYRLYFEGNPPNSLNQITFNNVVFDDLPTGTTSLGEITATGNNFTTKKNVYPSVLNELDAPYSPDSAQPTGGNPNLILNDNSYQSRTSINSEYLAPPCQQLPFLIGDLYVSKGSAPATGSATNRTSITIRQGGSVLLNAVVQPVMSQVTHFEPNGYGAKPGLLAVGSPALTNSINFYEGGQLIGTASLSANGTLASLVVNNATPGWHLYTAQYPADAYYDTLNFGAVVVQVQYAGH